MGEAEESNESGTVIEGDRYPLRGEPHRGELLDAPDTAGGELFTDRESQRFTHESHKDENYGDRRQASANERSRTNARDDENYSDRRRHANDTASADQRSVEQTLAHQASVQAMERTAMQRSLQISGDVDSARAAALSLAMFNAGVANMSGMDALLEPSASLSGLRLGMVRGAIRESQTGSTATQALEASLPALTITAMRNLAGLGVTPEQYSQVVAETTAKPGPSDS